MNRRVDLHARWINQKTIGKVGRFLRYEIISDATSCRTLIQYFFRVGIDPNKIFRSDLVKK